MSQCSLGLFYLRDLPPRLFYSSTTSGTCLHKPEFKERVKALYNWAFQGDHAMHDTNGSSISLLLPLSSASSLMHRSCGAV